MKELYEAEIASLKTEMLDYDNQLIESFFDFKNKDITEVLVEIRAGTLFNNMTSLTSFNLTSYRHGWL